MISGGAMAENFEVVTRTDIEFAEHDGTKLVGDLYLPRGLDKAPMLVGVHGGGWQIGDRKFYTHWGSYLAKNGYAVFSVEYRLMKPGFKRPIQALSTTSKRRCSTSAPGPGNLASTLTASHSWATRPERIFRHWWRLPGRSRPTPPSIAMIPIPRSRTRSRRWWAFMVFTTCFGNGSTIR